jgi:hypothetical protein
MKNKIGTHRNDTYLFTGYIFISDKDKSHVRNDIIRKKNIDIQSIHRYVVTNKDDVY